MKPQLVIVQAKIEEEQIAVTLPREIEWTKDIWISLIRNKERAKFNHFEYLIVG